MLWPCGGRLPLAESSGFIPSIGEAEGVLTVTCDFYLNSSAVAMQIKNGTLRADTITRDKLKGPAHGGYVSDLEARINDGKGPLYQGFSGFC